MDAEGKEVEGELIKATDEGITLKWKERRPKEIGKGKETVEVEREILYSEIRKALVIIKF